MASTTSLLEFLRKRGLQLFVVFGWLVVIFYFSSQPHSAEETELFFGSWNLLVRKASHISEYTILTGLFWWLYQPSKQALTFAALSSICYAITDEFHQSFVPGRGASPIDVLIDSSGVGVAILLLIIFMRRS
jgi:VanZ family protein